MTRLCWPLFVGALCTPSAFGQSTPEDVAFFEQKIRPLLVSQCFSCHSEIAKKQQGGLRLDSRDAVLRGGDNGPAAVAGDAGKSLLVKAVRHADADLHMPPKNKLADREIANLERWVQSGLAYPTADKGPAVARKIDIDAGRKFWSFQPLTVTEPSAVKAPTRIDGFLRAELDKRHIEPGGPAPRATLIRRAKFDLLGLPPTPEEVAAFVADPDPAAFPKLVDRWLAAPQYGERWGRHWLDLVRYCDIAEAWAETKGLPHHYRDWVVKAVNDDVPYPRFLKLQLAADQTPDATPGDQAALGFIGLSPTYWKELELPVEIIKTIVSDEYEERVHTLSSAFLGLNIACARCHDHKFDPVTAEDYYALAGVFASTKTTDRAMAAGIDGEKVAQAREQVTKLDADLKKLGAKRNIPSVIQAAHAQGKIATLKATPGYDATLTPGVRDGTLAVLPADKKHGSKVVYTPAPLDMPLEIRGNPNRPGQVVPRRFVSVLSKGTPAKFTHGSGRLDLADAMATDAAPLLARVFVNRVWKHHFGVGIVATPSDFGAQGDRPTHPALLDDLAARFIANGWSLKWLHREVMATAAYQQAGGQPPAGDANFRYYSRFPRQRLDVEAWRDALLAVSGTLDLKVGCPPAELSLPTNNRRTLYGTVKRRELTDLLRLHDFPDPVTHSPDRIPTITPLQQLFALNSPLLAEQSAAFAKRLKTDAGPDAAKRITRAYQLAFGRQPKPAEAELGMAFVKPDTDAAWQQYAQVLLDSNEFMFVD